MNVETLRKILAGETYGENIALCEMKQVLSEYDTLHDSLINWIKANAAATALINEQLAEIERLRRAVQQ